MLIYDCEIEKAILGKNDEKIPGIDYCDGFQDFEKMGISCICAYDMGKDLYRVFLIDNFSDFQGAVYRHDVIIGFNSIAFDNRLCQANDIQIPFEKSYDILVETWIAAGLEPEFKYPSHKGFSLNEICIANNLPVKNGNGAQAPIDWQRGNFGRVIDYCLNDVHMTAELVRLLIESGGEIRDPRNLENFLNLDIKKLTDF